MEQNETSEMIEGFYSIKALSSFCPEIANWMANWYEHNNVKFYKSTNSVKTLCYLIKYKLEILVLWLYAYFSPFVAV